MRNLSYEHKLNAANFVAAVVKQGRTGLRAPILEIAAAATGAGAGIAADGGFLAPPEFAQELWRRVYDTGSILDRCAPQPITAARELKVPAITETSRADGSRFGGAQMFWRGEGAAPTASKPKFGGITLALDKLLGLVYSTEDLVADAPALTAVLTRIFGLEAAFKIEDAIINGTGAGQPVGVINAPATITVAKETGQAAATILRANLVKMAARLWGPSHRSAIWLLGNDGYEQVANLTFTDGSPMVTDGPDGGRRLLQMPMLLVEYTPVLGTAGDILLCDFSQYLVSERAPDVISSIHVRFANDERAFRLAYRIAGQPGWATAITPNNGSATLSPFVTLGARS